MFYPLLQSKRAHSTLVHGARAWVPDANAPEPSRQPAMTSALAD
jgi:hypothetical protein